MSYLKQSNLSLDCSTMKRLGLKPRGLCSNKPCLESVEKKAIIEAYNMLLGNCLAQVVSQSPRFLSRLVLTSSKIFLEVGITKAFKTL